MSVVKPVGGNLVGEFLRVEDVPSKAAADDEGAACEIQVAGQDRAEFVDGHGMDCGQDEDQTPERGLRLLQGAGQQIAGDGFGMPVGFPTRRCWAGSRKTTRSRFNVLNKLRRARASCLRALPDALLYYRSHGTDTAGSREGGGSMLRAFVEVDRATMGTRAPLLSPRRSGSAIRAIRHVLKSLMPESSEEEEPPWSLSRIAINGAISRDKLVCGLRKFLHNPDSEASVGGLFLGAVYTPDAATHGAGRQPGSQESRTRVRTVANPLNHH
ncbi:hypothetical protein RI578_39320 [Streptomyces sp. BB1-1-1]|uniref:hypothetical protein n=1 Tax=Streptomyces sp. BB1-1-1 TaxID=3074430 RepID=UPI002877DC4A|nr:hypothetical protein [Streptomyces sp. BB1-1-1]WND39960.1 hypothetical protein RI578_39320 [Streptomyces sp. BB1-1-1]